MSASSGGTQSDKDNFIMYDFCTNFHLFYWRSNNGATRTGERIQWFKAHLTRLLSPVVSNVLFALLVGRSVSDFILFFQFLLCTAQNIFFFFKEEKGREKKKKKKKTVGDNTLMIRR